MIDLKKFIITTIIFYIIFSLIPLEWLQGVVAYTSSSFLSFVGVNNYLAGATIGTDSVFHISKDCTGILSIAIIIGLSAASSANIKRKILVIFSSLIVFPLWNAVRISLSIMSGGAFELVHFSLWIVSFFIILAFYFLLEYNPNSLSR